MILLLGWTVLMQSSNRNWKSMVDWMLKNGADPNKQMLVTGWTAMHSAARKGNIDILKALLDNKGNKNLKGQHQSLGVNLIVEDCTVDQNIIALLAKY